MLLRRYYMFVSLSHVKEAMQAGYAHLNDRDENLRVDYRRAIGLLSVLNSPRDREFAKLSRKLFPEWSKVVFHLRRHTIVVR